MALSLFKNLLQNLGPGILFASTAIGVSHLVQSTRAGAEYGLGLLWAVLLANLFKFPFFEYGSRYANVAGESLIDGYRRLGKGMLALYSLITLLSMFFVAAAVGAVTAGFLHQLLRLEGLLNLPTTTTLLFATCIVILRLGQYGALEKLIKVIGTVLLISTLISVGITLWQGPQVGNFSFFTPDAVQPGTAAFAFLIALMGWMPTALDLSTWNSLWTVERLKRMKKRPALRDTLHEFNLGYLASAVLAPAFLLLGAYLLYGSERSMPAASAQFASGIVDLYAESMGAWSRPLITAAAFSIMFGTCIAVFDGYARSSERVFQLFFPGHRVGVSAQKRQPKAQRHSPYYQYTLAAIGLGALAIIFYFSHSLKALVDFATSLSFVLAPLIAVANFWLVMHLPRRQDRPGAWMQGLSYLGILFLLGFSVVYLYWLWG